MKRILLLFITLVAICQATVCAQQAEVMFKPKFFFGGRVDVMSYYDSYATIDSRNGVQYMMPAPPVYNSRGEDINAQARVRMSIAPSRLFMGVDVPDVLGGKGRAYIETDFMGNGEAFINIPRIRHAYFSLDWERQSVIIGQTSHLSSIDHAAANTVSFGGGYPFFPLARPIQMRFTQKFAQHGQFAFAMAMAGGGVSGVEQSYALLPDLHARLLLGDPNSLSAGVAGGVCFLRPRTLTADSSITRKSLMAWDVTAFVKYAFGGHSLTAFGIVGTNLRRYEMTGGYAPLLNNIQDELQDYNYCGITTFSTWLDFNSKSYDGWRYGLFAGLQKNLGASQPVRLSLGNLGVDENLSFYWRFQPRVTYTYKYFLTFGLEYSYSQAQWSHMNDRGQATQVLTNTGNNRVTFLARFVF